MNDELLHENERIPNPHGHDRALRLSAEAFARFDLWMDVQLDQLVSRYQHLAAPAAGRMGRGIAPAPEPDVK